MNKYLSCYKVIIYIVLFIFSFLFSCFFSISCKVYLCCIALGRFLENTTYCRNFHDAISRNFHVVFLIMFTLALKPPSFQMSWIYVHLHWSFVVWAWLLTNFAQMWYQLSLGQYKVQPNMDKFCKELQELSLECYKLTASNIWMDTEVKAKSNLILNNS